MSDETGTNDQPVKVELHLHLSLRPDPRLGAVPYGPMLFDRAALKPSRWVGRTFGAVALIALSVVAMTVAHRMMAGTGNEELAAARWPAVAAPPSAPAHADPAALERPASGGDGHDAGAAPARAGTAAFGLN